MPLSTPNLDDRHFQDIVDEAKRLIPRFCPEWTDHNVSDPGVALIELFAWMVEMLLYRVNQVPRKVYIKFLELLGIRLQPPQAARAPVTFYLSSAPQNETQPLLIKKGTEIATVRTETSPAIVFTTEADIRISLPRLIAACTETKGTSQTQWVVHDLLELQHSRKQITIFSSNPVEHEAFYLAFETDVSGAVLKLKIGCEEAENTEADPLNPPFIWEAWQDEQLEWVPCFIEYDSTGGVSQDGEILLHCPLLMSAREYHGISACWLRYRVGRYLQNLLSPKLERYFHVEAWGRTVMARHGSTVCDESITTSDGSPGQIVKLFNSPILPRETDTDYLEVRLPDRRMERWHEVEHFADSGPEDRHYTLDSFDGTITFGPALLQPDGGVCRFGAVPPQGSVLCFRRYQYGGGMIGNVPSGTLAVLKTALPYVSRVVNYGPAYGGRDPESLELAALRAAHFLRQRTRAVTADDYEFLAGQVEGVARTYCHAPHAQPGATDDPTPGRVHVYILPRNEDFSVTPTPEQLIPSEVQKDRVETFLSQRCPLGIRLEVHPPQYTWVRIHAVLRVSEALTHASIDKIQRDAEMALSRYLNPYTGGPNAQGWPFGRTLYRSELYSVLQQIEQVDFVENLDVYVLDLKTNMSSRRKEASVVLPAFGLICSAGRHDITVSSQ